MKSILLLGANGQLGSDIQKVFSESNNIQVIPIFRAQLDVEKYDLLYPFLEKSLPFDYIINCTSYHKTDECEDYPSKSFAVNTIAVREMAKFCHRYNKTLIHISTDYVFDGQKMTPYIEEDATAPLNVYGLSKAAGEQAVRAYHDKYFIFRVSSLFGQAGASGKGGNFVETMIKLAKEGKALRVIDDQFMSPTHTLDVARALKVFIEQEIQDYGIYHCSGEGQTSWFQFAKTIFSLLNIDANLSPVSYKEYKTKAKRPKYSVLDNKKLNRIYKMPYWQDALEEYFKIKGYLS